MIVLSCGHAVENFNESYDVRVKSESRDCFKAVSYKVVCEKCMLELQQHDLLLDSEAAVNEWLLK